MEAIRSTGFHLYRGGLRPDAAAPGCVTERPLQSGAAVPATGSCLSRAVSGSAQNLRGKGRELVSHRFTVGGPAFSSLDVRC